MTVTLNIVRISIVSLPASNVRSSEIWTSSSLFTTIKFLPVLPEDNPTLPPQAFIKSSKTFAKVI